MKVHSNIPYRGAAVARVVERRTPEREAPGSISTTAV